MQLVLPSIAYKSSYIEAVKEFQVDADNSHASQSMKNLSTSELEADFEKYVAIVLGQAHGENLPEDWVPMTTYWLVDNGEYVGQIRIRHRLNEKLSKFHGHIGYDIRPSQRGKGYGSKMLALALPKAKELGLSKLLITCMTTNTGSRKIIEKNGGVFESQVHDSEYDADLLRFWIDL